MLPFFCLIHLEFFFSTVNVFQSQNKWLGESFLPHWDTGLQLGLPFTKSVNEYDMWTEDCRVWLCFSRSYVLERVSLSQTLDTVNREGQMIYVKPLGWLVSRSLHEITPKQFVTNEMKYNNLAINITSIKICTLGALGTMALFMYLIL